MSILQMSFPAAVLVVATTSAFAFSATPYVDMEEVSEHLTQDVAEKVLTQYNIEWQSGGRQRQLADFAPISL